jgi:teichuronic acid exporter
LPDDHDTSLGQTKDATAQAGKPLSEGEPSRLVSASRGVFWSSVNTVGPLLVTMSVFVVTSRILSPTDFGIVALASTVALLASCLVPAGFGDALVQNAKTQDIHFDTVMWLCIGCALALYGVVSLGAVFAAPRFGQPTLAYLLPILGLRIIMDAAAIAPLANVRRRLSFRSLAIRTTISSVVAGVISLALALSGQGYWALVGSQLASSFVGALGAFWAAKWRPGLRFSWDAHRDLRHFGGYASGTRIVNALTQQCDQLIVGLVLGIRPLGLYAFARKATGILSDVIAGTLTTVGMPLMSSVQEERNALTRGFLLAIFLSSLVAFPVFGGLAMITPQAVPLIFGAHWNAAIPTIQLLCLVGFLLAIGMLQASLINSVGGAQWWFFYQTFTVVTYIGVIAAFAPFGLHAMMLAITVRGYLFFPIPCLKAAKILGFSLIEYARQFAGPTLATATMAAALAARQSLLHIGAPVAAVGVDLVIGAIVYIVVVTRISRPQVLLAISIARRAISRR